jgi:serine protease Do
LSSEAKGVHTAVSTTLSFAILFGVVGYSFAYVSDNPVELPPAVGIDVFQVTPQLAQGLGMSEARGLLITAVASGSPADRAGLQAIRLETRDGQQVPVSWDVIIEMDGNRVDNERDVQAVLQEKRAGDTIRFTILRNNTTININVVLQ